MAGSVTHWIGGLKDGDDEAARELWQRLLRWAGARARRGCAMRLVPLSTKKTRRSRPFTAFVACAAAGRFPQLDDRDNLWRLLATLTAQKAVDQRRHEGREKRGAGRAHAGDQAPGDAGIDAMLEIVGREPSPEFAAQLDEQYRLLLDRLEDDGLRQIAVWKMEGDSNDEIARRLGCGLRTVERKLGVIRAIWLALDPG